MGAQIRGKVIEEQRVYSVGAQAEERSREVARRIGGDLKAGRIKLRPLPRVAVELSKLASSQDPDIGRALEIIQRDAQLATKVLKAASSSVFGSRPPRDLRQASMRLGVTGMRDMAFAVSMKGVFRCPPLDSVVKEDMQHGFVTGILTGFICKMMKLDAQQGFIAGLLHDVGRMVVVSALAEYGRQDKTLLDLDFVERVAKGAHPRLGAYLLAEWGFPPEIQQTSLYHHKPSKSEEGLPTVVAMADYVDDLGGSGEAERASRLFADPCPFGPDLSTAHIDALAQAAEAARNDPIRSSRTSRRSGSPSSYTCSP
jgi:HD-like signal output (HDOD) protein